MSELAPTTYQALLDTMNNSVLVIDSEMSISYMNPSAEMLFDISKTRAFGRPIMDLLHGDAQFYSWLKDSINTGHPYTAYDASLNLTSGKKLDVDYMVSQFVHDDDEISLLIEIVKTGRHRKLAEEERLLRQQEASKQLLRGLAHEIKNPLGGLRGSAQLLEKTLQEKDKEYTNIIINEADRLQNLVDRMLGPRDIPNKTNLNIHKVLEHIRQLVQVESEAITITTDYDPSMPDINGDESMLIQSILNITRNAVSASPNDGSIQFKTRTVRHHTIRNIFYPLVARIDVTDHGEGVPEDIKEQIFLPMITGRAEGTGLGLSIAQSLVSQHSGLIECESRPGETIFSILIPLGNNDD